MKHLFITITNLANDDTYIVACKLDLRTFMFSVFQDEMFNDNAVIYEGQAEDGMDCRPLWIDPMVSMEAKQQIDNFILGIYTALNF